MLKTTSLLTLQPSGIRRAAGLFPSAAPRTVRPRRSPTRSRPRHVDERAQTPSKSVADKLGFGRAAVVHEGVDMGALRCVARDLVEHVAELGGAMAG